MNFLELANKRYSLRDYSSTPVEKEKLDYILETARLAPSACNKQPWFFLVVTNPDGIQKLYDCYPRDWFKTVHTAIVVCGDRSQSWKRQEDEKDHMDIDAAIAAEHICLAAAEQELGTCWICNFDIALCKKEFNIPEELEPIAIIPIGYAANKQSHPEKKRKNPEEIIKYESF